MVVSLSEIVVISLAIMGFHYSFHFNLVQPPVDSGLPIRILNKEFLWWYRYWVNRILKVTRLTFFSKPLTECPVCMAGPYGTIGYIAFNYPHLNPISCAVEILAIAGINRLIWTILNR